MTQEISVDVLPQRWGGYAALSICPEAENLYNDVLKIHNFSPRSLQTLLDEHIHKASLEKAPPEQQLDVFVFSLTKLAIKVSNISKNLVVWMDKYQYPEGKSWYHHLLFWQYHEKHMPPCDLGSQTTLSRERFVACRQVINYFAELWTNKILSRCNVISSSAFQLPLKLKNIGSYLLYSESPREHIVTRNPTSWALRREWNLQVKERYCKDSSKYWHSYLCAQDNETKAKDQKESIQSWYKHIFPKNTSAKDIYPTSIVSEINYAYNDLKHAQRSFYVLLNNLNPLIEKSFLNYSQKSSKLQSDSQLARQLITDYQLFLTAREDLEGIQSIPNWEKVQTLVDKIETFIKENRLEEKYPYIEEDIEKAKLLKKPSQNLEL